MINIPKSIQKSCCNAENKKRHCESQAWQSQPASDVYNRESETPLTAVGTLTSLLRNSTKVLENLSQKIAFCKVLSISIITLFLSFFTVKVSSAAVANCETYGSSSNICVKCKSGYIMNSSRTCSLLSSVHCLESNGTLCTECEDGYVISSYSRNQCIVNNIPNCKQGISGRCDACKDGYIRWDNNTTCVTLESIHCLSTDSDTYYCSRCEEGYAVGNSRACIPSPVADCRNLSYDEQSCSRCNIGYVRTESGSCITASEAHCLSSDDGYGCNGGCAEGYAGTVEGNGKCILCEVENCATCSDNGKTCSYCNAGYAVQANGTCKAVDNIEHCERQNWNNTGCEKCEDGFYFENDKCVAECSTGNHSMTSQYYGALCVPQNCAEAGLNGSGVGCTRCSSGYYLLAESGTLNCVTSCPSGYSANNGYSCIPEYCNASNVKCVACRSDYGYYLTPDNNCVAECESGYLKTSVQTFNGTELRCIPEEMGCGNMIRHDNECVSSCPEGLTEENGVCRQADCGAGQYLDGSECKPCAAGTYAEAGDNVCSSCGAHEYSAAGASSCTPRQNFSNCNEFSTDSDECTSCKTGYKSENGGCVSLCSGGKVYWDGECYDEYPFAKKRYTPAEAAPWLKDNGNIVTLIFKK